MARIFIDGVSDDDDSNGDYVDGQAPPPKIGVGPITIGAGGPSAFSAPVPIFPHGINEPVASTSAAAATAAAAAAENQELAWKTLALTMCEMFKRHYFQKSQGENPITSALVQITPSGHANNQDKK